ncbi:hypothetical protein D3C81_1448850 [compost metagenome]
MPLTDDTLLDQLEHTMEQRLREMLPPWPGLAQGFGQVEVELLHGQAAIRQKAPGKVFFAQLTPHFLVKRLGKGREVALRQRQPCRHGMTAELADQLRMARRYRIQRITNMKPWHRTCRTFEHAIAGIGKGDGRPVVTLLQA